MKVLYIKNATWEVDFINVDIFHFIKDKIEIEYFDGNDLEKYLIDEKIINNNILVISQYCIPFIKIEYFVQKIKPVFIFHLSDEDGDAKEWLSLSEHTKILFRQYNHIKYNNPYKNITQIPLGYVAGFLKGNYSLDIEHSPLSKRKYTCSFIGKIKSDRQTMIDLFEKNLENTCLKCVDNNFDINNLVISQSEMYSIYSKSVFVLIGRGNKSLDCFRIYEAIVAGAIPVIVGDNEEINNTFKYDGDKPPFLYYSSWEEAQEQCKILLNNFAKLQEISGEINEWWKRQILSIQNKIGSTVI